MNPSVGISSILGWLTFAGFETTSVTTAATGSQADLAGPAKWTAILGIVALGITNAGRYLQAHKMTSPTVSRDMQVVGGVLPTLAQELASPPPQSRATPDGAVQAAPPSQAAPVA
jgi:hypothetical protein